MANALQGKYTGQHFGSVKLLEKVGSGGMGEVYKGYHEIMQIDVAVKLIHPHLAESEKARYDEGLWPNDNLMVSGPNRSADGACTVNCDTSDGKEDQCKNFRALAK